MRNPKFYVWQNVHDYSHVTASDIISYPLFADADTGIYPRAASQYHAGPKVKRGIAMLSDILKRFRSFKTQRSH